VSVLIQKAILFIQLALIFFHFYRFRFVPMSKPKIFVATSQKYPTLIGQEFDISKGVYILMKNGKVIAQDNSNLKLVSMVPDHKTDSNDQFQLANLLLVRDDLHFLQHLHCI